METASNAIAFLKQFRSEVAGELRGDSDDEGELPSAGKRKTRDEVQKTVRKAAKRVEKQLDKPMLELDQTNKRITGKAISDWYPSANARQAAFKAVFEYLVQQVIKPEWDAQERRVYQEVLRLRAQPGTQNETRAYPPCAQEELIQQIDRFRMLRLTMLASIEGNLSMLIHEQQQWKAQCSIEPDDLQERTLNWEHIRVLLSHLRMHEQLSVAHMQLPEENICYTCNAHLRQGVTTVLTVPYVRAFADAHERRKSLSFSICGECDRAFGAWHRMVFLFDNVRKEVLRYRNHTHASMSMREFVRKYSEDQLGAAYAMFEQAFEDMVEQLGVCMTQVAPPEVARGVAVAFADMFAMDDPRANLGQQPVMQLSQATQAVMSGAMQFTGEERMWFQVGLERLVNAPC